MRSIVVMVLIGVIACGSAHQFERDHKPPSHRPWTGLLQLHVDSTGLVDYVGFVADSVPLKAYCQTLADSPPNKTWKKEDELAYWINVYNAFTVKLIVDHYPVVSIKDIKKGIPMINSVWEMKFFRIGEKEMSLSEVEHDILRKEFEEPRIHFAIVCASRSCPRLLNEAFEAEKLEQQLTAQTVSFINDTSRNEIETDEVRISPIFKWFKKDFTKNGTLQEFVGKYSSIDVHSDARIGYLEYDWSLNGK